MNASAAFALLRIPAFVASASGILLAILSQAMATSYMTLLAVERAGMGPLQLSVFLTASGASGIVFTALFGRLLDRGSRWPLLLSLVASIAGFALFALVTDPLWLTLIAATLIGLGAPAFPVLFGIAKGHLDGAEPATSSSGMAALRMLASLAWAIGPALGALFVGLWHFPGVFFGAAGCGVVALAVVFAARLRPIPPLVKRTAEDVPAVALWRVALPAALALVLFHTAMFMGVNAMSIVVVADLKGSETDVGLLFSLCAALEVVVMGVYVVRPAHRASRSVIVIGFVLLATYSLGVLLVPSLATLYWAQILRAIAIGIVSVLGMMYLQELMPTRPGAAAALFANATNASFLLSGLGTGTWANFFGYWSMFGFCAAIVLLGGAMVAITWSAPRGPFS